jgi:hypothetical protein
MGIAIVGPMCHAKTQLLLAYQKAAVRYSKAVNKLSRYVGTISEIEYKPLSLTTERARKMCHAAKDALRFHVSQHHC